MNSNPIYLEDLLPEDAFVGVSLVLPSTNSFLFGIRAPKKHEDQLILEITGIGGGREVSDKTLEDTARREAQEEICSDIQLLDSPFTLIIYNQTSFASAILAGIGRPAAIVYRNYRTPPHQPWYKEHLGKTCLVIYLAEISGQPWPCGELPWLIWLTPNQILDAARNDIPLSNLLNSGATLITGNSPLPPVNSIARLTDSQEALALALGDKTYNFYENAKKLI